MSDLNTFSDALADAVEHAARSIVLVDARRRFPASGIVFGSGLVLTASHVVEREEDIRILLPNGSETSASLVGRDPGMDLVVLRLAEAAAVAAAQTAPAARVGQLVLALGRPSAQGVQASLGVVSAIGGLVRTGRGALLEQYLRTDAVPLPGFSGGPLIDSAGRVLGMNTSGFWRGGSLTIPHALAWQAAQGLVEHGHVRRGYLGIRSQEVALSSTLQQALGRSQASGLLVVEVEDDSPALRGEMMVGDILVGLGGRPVQDADDLLARLQATSVGQVSEVEVLRGGQARRFPVTIEERK